MRILFVCRNFHDMAGGIERMATWIMNEMNEKIADLDTKILKIRNDME